MNVTVLLLNTAQSKANSNFCIILDIACIIYLHTGEDTWVSFFRINREYISISFYLHFHNLEDSFIQSNVYSICVKEWINQSLNNCLF